jgi:NRPS condensation-like uncharacterized protein
MSLVKFLAQLRDLNINIWVENDTLRYKAPRGVVTTELLAGIKARRTEIIDFLQQVNAYTIIEPTPEREYYAVSAAQRRMYIINQMEPNSVNYNMPSGTIIEGVLNQDRLTSVFRKFVQRHEAFRTSFELIDDEPRQRISKAIELEIEYCQATETELPEIINKFIRPFDLNKAPLIRVGLVSLQLQKHLLLVDMHHIISDEVSINILIQEFFDLYDGKELPSLRIQYKDYAAWQNRFFQTVMFKQQEKYWRGFLKGKIPILKMPYDFPRPKIRTFTGSTVDFKIESIKAKKIHILAKKHNVTLNTLLFAIYGFLIHQYSGQDDIIIGSLVAGRQHADLDNIIGVFINFLPIRIRFNSDATFEEYLDFAKEILLASYNNQDYPFEMMLEQSNYEVVLSRNPLFDTMLVFHDQFDPHFQQNVSLNKGLRFEPYQIRTKTSKLDLKLDIISKNTGEFDCTFEYNTCLFMETTINQMIGHFNLIIDKI